MVAASARLEEKVGHLGDALSILTETSEAGFKAIADELTRRARGAGAGGPLEDADRAAQGGAPQGARASPTSPPPSTCPKAKCGCACISPSTRRRRGRGPGPRKDAPMRCAHEACARWAPGLPRQPSGPRRRARRRLVLLAAVPRSRDARPDRARAGPVAAAMGLGQNVSRLGALLVHRKLITTATLDARVDAAGRQRPPARRRARGDGRAPARRSAAHAGDAVARRLPDDGRSGPRRAPRRAACRATSSTRSASSRSKRTRSAAASSSPVPRRCRAWRSPCCGRSSPRRWSRSSSATTRPRPCSRPTARRRRRPRA